MNFIQDSFQFSIDESLFKHFKDNDVHDRDGLICNRCR